LTASSRGTPNPSPSPSPEHQLESLQRLTDSALGYLSLEDMLAELLERIRSVVGADTAAVLLLDRDRGVLLARAARGIEEEVREGVRVPLARGFAGRVAAEGRPVVIEDLSQADVVNPLLRRKGIRSLLGVPLHVKGRVIGVLHVGTLHPRAFSDDDVQLLQLAADRVALAIDNAQLSEQRAATEIMQRTLLPDALPQVPGLRFSAKYLPAGPSVRLGGDWYDVFSLPDGRVAFVIGDVVGRGMAAAALMTELRSALRAYALEGHEPARAMSLLNALLASMGRNRSATVAIHALDVEREQLWAVSAGHLPALLREPDGRCRYIDEAQGPPLGVNPGFVYGGQSVDFPTGSALLLYTDGLLERRDESLDLGFERLASRVSVSADPDGLTLADSVYRGLLDGAPLEDDVALLAIESVPLGPRLQLNLEATPNVLASLRRGIGCWLLRNGVPEEERFDIALASSEAAGNAIEHAYGPHDATFDVDCQWSPGEVRVTVSDRGSWRGSTSRGRGRGLTIMRELMDGVDIEQGDDGTTVSLVKHLPDRA
jgi:serine phosphatase RsbU (regulator of sigma subunit)/anti-sigma regulatory factor (Ser/Thr protein kinase)